MSLSKQASSSHRKDENYYHQDCCRDSRDLTEIHKLLRVITKITNHIENQNETIIQENRKLRDENASLELHLKLLLQRNKDMNGEVELLIAQNKEFRESLDQFKNENGRLRVELKQQNTKLRLVIDTLKDENNKLKTEIDEGVKILQVSKEKKRRTRERKSFWKNLCPQGI